MRARACRGLVAKKKTERSRGEKEKRGSNELKVKSVWKREEAEREREREEKRKERKLWERTNWADIALEFARRVYAIFTLDLIFWRRPSLSRDRYMSHGHTRAARIKTSKRSQREFLIPSAARFSSPPPLSPRPASISFSILVAPSSRLPPYLVYPSFLPTASFHLLLFRLLRAPRWGTRRRRIEGPRP